ncbi:hypothetical protein [Aestuariivita sp.]|jgi:hypothetical protein|uniref:hypothetical protein n=1 Tax=Aestuariivita sp. TaxID=1872407 RepID=UPI00217457FF|nr:hypothetical protein [Aestuariivita sp.]MCE8005936.1 hypothetical protein [Aestuariivita sp.]
MRRPALIAAALATTACTVPDVGTDVHAVTDLVSETTQTVSRQFGPVARDEFQRAERNLITSGQRVLRQDGVCQPELARSIGKSTADCALINLAEPTAGPVNASQVLLALVVISNYWSAIATLASAETRAEVVSAARNVFAAFDKAADSSGSPALAEFSRSASSRGPLLTTGIAFSVDQFRAAKLRQIMTRADPVLEELTEDMSAWLTLQPDSGLDAFEAYNRAKSEMGRAQQSGNVDRYRLAIAETRRSFEAFQAQQAQDPVNRLWLIRTAHADILARLQNPTATDILATLEQIKTLQQLAQQKVQP